MIGVSGGAGPCREQHRLGIGVQAQLVAVTACQATGTCSLPEGQWSRSVVVAFTAVAGQWAPPVQQSVVRSAACEPQQQWLMGLGIEQARPPRGQMPMPLITIDAASTAVASLPSTIGPKVTAGYRPVKGWGRRKRSRVRQRVGHAGDQCH